MIPVAAPVKHDSLHTGILGAFRHDLPDDLCFVQLRLALLADLLLHFRIERRGRGQRVAYGIVDHLSIDMLQAAVHVQARAFRCPGNTGANAAMTTLTRLSCTLCHGLLTLTSLARLTTDDFTFVANTLALVRLRGTQVANVGGN